MKLIKNQLNIKKSIVLILVLVVNKTCKHVYRSYFHMKRNMGR